MPFSGAFETYPLVQRARRLRRNPTAAYGIALAAVAVATVLREVVQGQVIAGLPFITYYPAIIIAALAGGLWPGLLSVVLSAVIAWYQYLPPVHSWDLEPHAAVTLLLFVLVSLVNVAIVIALDIAIERLISQEQNVRILVESAPNGIVVIDSRGRIGLVNQSMERLFGYKRQELLGKSVEVLVPDRQAETHTVVREQFHQKPEARAMGAGRDLSGRRKDGSEFPVEIGLNPVSHNGKAGVLATVIDISARKRVEEQQQFTIRELQHRTRNLFAVARAVADNTLVQGRTVTQAKYVLSGRLQALAQAYDLVADAGWEGASLAAILERQFTGFSNRLKVDGCEIVMNVSAAQQFAMITHELATNALKYGALSKPEGRVFIEGRTDRSNGDGVFSFRWTEMNGPPVEPPTRKGFGSVILGDVARQFGRRVTMDYAPHGLSYELLVSLSEIEASAKRGAGTA